MILAADGLLIERDRNFNTVGLGGFEPCPRGLLHGLKSLLLRLTPGGTASEFWHNGDIPFVIFAVPDHDSIFKRASFTTHAIYPFPTVENVFHSDAR